VNDPKCGKHDDVIDRISALESVVSTQIAVEQSTKEQVRLNTNRIEEISKMHSLLSEVKVEIKHIHEKLDTRSVKDMLIEAIIPAMVYGSIIAYAFFSRGGF